MSLVDIGRAIGEGISNIGTYSAQAAAQANSVSAASQSAQGAFNQASADQANLLNIQNMNNQYAYNSAMASSANNFTASMWQKAADWNEAMWEKQAEFNKKEAQKNREWQEMMRNTQYQTAVQDMEKAGLNPILAVTGGGVGTSVPGGATASVGGSTMGTAQGAMASGGLLGANSASESNYMEQMEYLSGTLGLISACISGLASAAGAAGSLGDVGEGLMETAGKMLYGGETGEKFGKIASATANKWEKETSENGLGKGTWETVKDVGKAFYDTWKDSKKKGQITNRQDEAQYLRYNAWNNSTWKYTRPKG